MLEAGGPTSNPETTDRGVERFNRTLREQVIYGRVFKSLDAVLCFGT